MGKEYIMALDQGTTSSRAVIFDHQGKMISIAAKEFRQIFPQPGWVEHDPMEIWDSQMEAARQALDSANLSPQQINYTVKRKFIPRMSSKQREALYRKWKMAVERARGWEQEKS
jgi:glycerol kinase